MTDCDLVLQLSTGCMMLAMARRQTHNQAFSIQGTVILGSGLRPHWSLGVSKVTGFLGAGRVAKIGLVPRLIM